MNEESFDGITSSRKIERDGLSGRFYEPLGTESGPGVLVLHGSGASGERGYTDRFARLLAHHGYAALDLAYFDAPGTSPDLVEVPLEYFSHAIDWLVAQREVTTERVGTVAWSRGTEAQFLLAAHDDRVGVAIAYVLSAYAFPGLPGNEPTDGSVSAWSRDGDPVPFVPPYDGIEDDMDESSLVRFRRTVERASPDVLERAVLPTEDVSGSVLLVSGEKDATWPSSQFAETLANRLSEHEHRWPYEHLRYPDAGHGIASPYRPPTESLTDSLGGTRPGNSYANADAWFHTLEFLRVGLHTEDS
jgi:dienelactone hydrolase